MLQPAVKPTPTPYYSGVEKLIARGEPDQKNELDTDSSSMAL